MMLKSTPILLYILLLWSLLLQSQTVPEAINDSYTTFINTTLNESAPGILSNDTDADDDALQVIEFVLNSSVYSAGTTVNFAQGTITILADGSFTYIPATDYIGSIPEISYTISDGTFTATATLNINIIHPPTAPVATDDVYETFTNNTLTISAPGILDNDSDINNDALQVTEFTIEGTTNSVGETVSFSQGNITIFNDGSITYVPLAGFQGNVNAISYTITDGVFFSSATINITVFLPPEPPIANDDYDTADINTTLAVQSPGVLINDSDQNFQDVLQVVRFSVSGITYNAGQTANLPQGNFTLFSDGSYSLIPTPNFTGELPIINYTISDGAFTDSANFFLSVEPTDDLIEIRELGSCNQGFTSDGNYKIRYDLILTNRSNAKDYHESSLIRNINLINNLQDTFGTECVVEVDEVSVRNDNFIVDYVGAPYPREFDNNSINNGFLNGTSNEFFNANAINNLTLYPRQSIFISFCVTVNAFCNGRPNPTPSGSGIDFTNTINITNNTGTATDSITLIDFHSTEAVISAGLYVPEFNNQTLNPPGTVNPNGTYDYVNTVTIRNEGSATANNINFNMGLGNFIANGISFDDILITQVSGPTVTVNSNYDGVSDLNLLAANNSLPAGETIQLEIYYLIGPFSASSYSYFNQIGISQTQGALDGFDETSNSSRSFNSFVTWSDGLGNHVDRYYVLNSSTATVSAELQCNCERIGMRFFFSSSSSTNNIISSTNSAPNRILEHEENTFQITITNTSEAVELKNLQLQDNLNSICGGNVISVTNPIILNSTAAENPILNPNFDGRSDINIFNGVSGTLQADESITIEFTVVFSETCNGTNRAVFTATNPLNRVVQSASSVAVSAFTDTDNDGIVDTEDLDDDNDTIPDILEYNGLDPLADDDADNLPNYRDLDFGPDANNDGIVDVFDFDNDGVPNHFDLDSDNDGILDIIEVGNALLDTSFNGRTNGVVGANGLENTVETNDTNNANINYVLINTDTNGNPNFIDIDSDDDGIVDNIEAQLTNNYASVNNIFSETGIDTAYPNGLTPIDTDNDGIFDYIDTNSDNDIRDDIIEGWDANSDGTPEITPLNSDVDNDGLDDAFDNDNNLVNPTNNQTPLSFPNFDNADTPERDWREIIAIVVLLSDASNTEGNTLDFTITLVTKNDNSILIESAFPITINFSTVDGASTTSTFDVATNPFDYTGISNIEFTIPPLANSLNFSVTSLDDPIFEIDELLTLNGSITSNNTINTSLTAIATIIDDEQPPSVEMNDSRGLEGTNLEHTIRISHPSSRPIIVEVFSRRNQAISPDDYLLFREELTIEGTIDPNNANTEISFGIITVEDNLNEMDEEILDVIGVLKTFYVSSQDLSKTGTIIDIDPNPFVQITDATVVEGEVLSFEIGLFNANSEPMQNYLPINFTLEAIDNTTFINEDYTFSPILLQFPAFTSTYTQNITTIDDRINEATESFFLQAIFSPLFTSNTEPIRGEGFIKDNDYPNLFSPNNDGKSDFFKIDGLEPYPNFKITIYNRAGNQIYSYSNDGRLTPIWWDGTSNGKPVPVGVYYYTLEFNDGSTKPVQSFIQLVR